MACVSQKESPFTFLLPMGKLFERLEGYKFVSLKGLKQGFLLSFQTFVCQVEFLFADILALTLSKVFLKS